MEDRPRKNRRVFSEVSAVNFAEDSTNRIHSDAVARRHGFRGGLVPGIAVFAYMTHPVVSQLGSRWLTSGFIRAKFIHPVYEGDRLRVEAETVEGTEGELEIRVTNGTGAPCAVGSAGLQPGDLEPPRSAGYPGGDMPPADRRMRPLAAHLNPGRVLGSFAFHESAEEALERVQRDYLDDLAIYRGPGAPYHPAYLLAQANRILMRNVDLGPWIHVGSDVRYFSAPQTGEELNIRGCIASSYQRRGHEMTDLDLAIFDADGRAVAAVKHTAIVRLKTEKTE